MKLIPNLRGAVLSAALLLVACDNMVHVRLVAEDCDDPGIGDVMSVYVELTRVDKTASFHIPCKSTQGLLRNVEQLESLLATYPSMEDVPTNGVWNLWVVGKNVTCSDTSSAPLTLLCGVARNFSMPPEDNELQVPITCESRLTTPERLQKIKETIKSCEAGLSPWRGP